MQDWLEWQRKVIREEYVEGEEMKDFLKGKPNFDDLYILNERGKRYYLKDFSGDKV